MEHIMFTFGKETYRAVLDQLQPAQQRIFRKRMPENSWLNLADFIDFNKAIINVVYKGNVASAERLGAEAAERGMTGALKFLLKLSNIRFSFRKATSVFVSYYKPAKLIVTRNEPGLSEARIVQLDDPDGIIALRIKGFLRKLFELGGYPPRQVNLERFPERKEMILQVHW
jgi:hypothetical protein